MTVAAYIANAFVLHGEKILIALSFGVWTLIVWGVARLITGCQWRATIHDHMDEITQEELATRDGEIRKLREECELRKDAMRRMTDQHRVADALVEKTHAILSGAEE